MANPSVRDELIRALRIDRIVDWLGASRRNRVIFVGIYIAVGALCAVAAILGLGAWPHG